MIDPRQDLLEAILEVLDAHAVNLLHLLTFIHEHLIVLTGDLLHLNRGLMDKLVHTLLQLLELLLLLLRDAEADQFVEACLHEVVHARHQILKHLEATCTLR